MYLQVLTFVLLTYLTLTATRLALCFWIRERVRNAGGIVPILLGGLRIDTTTIAIVTALPLLASPWLNNAEWAQGLNQLWLGTAWAIIMLLEVSTPQFIIEYDTRPNRLYIDYLKHPKEVMGMLWRGYKVAIGLALGLFLIICVGGFRSLAPPPDAVNEFSALTAALLSILAAALCFAGIRGTLRHRPINPSTVAYCGDSLLNTLALNSVYSVAYAIYSIKNERSASQVYGKMPDAEVHRLVLEQANIQPQAGPLNSLHKQACARQQKRPLNIVIIVEESLGAQFVGNLGGKDLTPCLDELAGQGWNFTRAYATGTRSVRGLEALSAGFPPTVSDAAVRLSGAQGRFFTLAQSLKLEGYRSHFVYGGEAHFDNMKSFFMSNGFDELHEQAQFEAPAFVGTWGASDEDMFNKVDDILGSSGEQPTLCLAFSVSNHSPWEYPEGRIEASSPSASVENTVRYADWAIGQFFAKAKNAAYWNNTVFLVVADHDARVGGANQIPLKHFHIPALILGGGITARSDDRLISQIDLPVTLLSLAGVSSFHPMIGQDLCHATKPRAMMQYGENYGYLEHDVLTVLEPGQKVSQYRYQAPNSYVAVPPDQRLIDLTKAHALWPTLVYDSRTYTLPHLYNEIKVKTATLPIRAKGTVQS
ncbi:LTA synthase family protein [Paenalcaligenes niemegkensis]|uniref:LTA synthase family protein n=1 Tax=Paenalcaligenes niemegkensis TaxID=2895469 RepID=UPI001EE7AD30|nr:LTA synthase family protein [Paenalcaligenes niemegkensis]MCQ9616029.1 LTA synthase family protein [Paenalcaligenes niemegkensis]